MYIDYDCKDGQHQLDISQAATRDFGFLFQDRVTTPLGLATVLGVNALKLYFLVDGDPKASYWSKCLVAEDFQRRGFKIVQEDQSTNSSHRLKFVQLGGRECGIVLQNENGPCPIIALVNALSLKGEVKFNKQSRVTSSRLREILFQYVKEERGYLKFSSPLLYEGKNTLAGLFTSDLPNCRKRIDYDSLQRFYEGINISPLLSHCDGFVGDPDVALFALAGLRVCHGWIIEDEDDEFSMLRNKSYEDVIAVATDEANQQHSAARRFLNQHSSQLTVAGVNHLQNFISEGEVCILFRNNHFSTMTKMNDKLICLVSDEGYADRQCIVFEQLVVCGAGSYCDGAGEEIVPFVLAIISHHGDKYSVEDIKTAVGVIISRNEQVPFPSEDDIVQFLNNASNDPSCDTDDVAFAQKISKLMDMGFDFEKSHAALNFFFLILTSH